MKFSITVLVYVIFTSETIYGHNSTIGDLPKENYSTLCTKEKCIMKCCPAGKVFNTKLFLKGKGANKTMRKKIICDNYNGTDDIPSLDNNTKNYFSLISNWSVFEIKSGIFQTNKTFRTRSMDMTDSSIFDFNIYLTENAEMLLETPNAYDRWITVPNNMYCLDFIVVQNETNMSLKPGVWAVYQTTSDETSPTNKILMTIAMLVSCFFLLVVLVVYGLLKELRNLCGLILMAYVASLFVAFLLMAVMRIKQHESHVCLGLTFSIYFFFMASFCWMNVMSYDIWWTFRGYAKARSIHRRGERFKFLMYCSYAWGLPLAMTTGLAVLNAVDLRHKPWFVTPKIPSSSCFIKEGEKLLYLYMPMLVLILCNWLFFMMTAYNVWRLSRGTAVLDSGAAGSAQAHRSNRRRFMIYLKLSIVMGINWLLEVMSYKYPNSSVWVISDFYNIFIGVSIFLIFVCKRKILKKLIKLFPRHKSQWSPNKAHSSKSATSTCDSSASQETHTAMCQNPKGSAYDMKTFQD